VDKLKQKLEQLAQRHGERFMPKKGWDNPALALSAGATPAPGA
jgi:3-hydroxyacyl-CoA dehydrogenase/enoyl-CoA hydratase/3-hydroxybutyryl-CoA epimerase